MERASSNTLSSSFSAHFVEFLFFYGFVHCILRFQNLYYLVLYFCPFHMACFVAESKSHGGIEERKSLSSETEEKVSNMTLREQFFCNDNEDSLKVTSRNVETVMAKMGMICDVESEKLVKCLGSDELSVLFEEEEPSLEEVKEAFNVFDGNRDGFIDAKELQRVLCNLGFREALKFDACERMIRAFDTNGDDKIDFNEFVKFMETSFC